MIRVILLVGFATAVFFHYVQAFYLGHLEYPSSTFLFIPHNHFSDFVDTHNATRWRDPYATHRATYFPFTFVAMIPFALIKGRPACWFYLAFLFGSVAAFFWRKLREENRLKTLENVFVFSFFSYPFLLLVDRANIEGILFVFLALFFHFLQKDRRALAALFLACATAMKGYPGLLALLYVPERRWKEIAGVVALTLALTGVGALIVGPGVLENLRMLKDNLGGLKGEHVLSEWALRQSSSLYAFLRISLSPFVPGLMPADPEVLARFQSAYGWVRWISLIGLSLGALALHRQALWKRVYLILAATLLLPEMSYDYKLVSLFIPLTLFLGAPPEPDRRKDLFFCVLFGLILIPKAYVIIHGEVTSSSLFHPLLLMILAAPLMGEAWRTRQASVKAVDTRSPGSSTASA